MLWVQLPGHFRSLITNQTTTVLQILNSALVQWPKPALHSWELESLYQIRFQSLSTHITLLKSKHKLNQPTPQCHSLEKEGAAPSIPCSNWIVTVYLPPAKFHRLLWNNLFQKISRRGKHPFPMSYMEQGCSADCANLCEVLESGGEQTVPCWIPDLSWKTWLGRSSGILKTGILETFPSIWCVTHFYTK